MVAWGLPNFWPPNPVSRQVLGELRGFWRLRLLIPKFLALPLRPFNGRLLQEKFPGAPRLDMVWALGGPTCFPPTLYAQFSFNEYQNELSFVADLTV